MGRYGTRKFGRKTPAEVLAAATQIDEATGCWLWTGPLSRDGYGKVQNPDTNQTVAAHRLSYEVHVGPVPEGQDLDHLCRTRRCIRPDHLEAVSHMENVLRSSGHVGKPTCAKGHPFDEANTWRRDEGRWISRRCRRCHADRERARRARAGAAS